MISFKIWPLCPWERPPIVQRIRGCLDTRACLGACEDRWTVTASREPNHDSSVAPAFSVVTVQVSPLRHTRVFDIWCKVVSVGNGGCVTTLKSADLVRSCSLGYLDNAVRGNEQQLLTLYSPVVTICTARWSLYVPHRLNVCTAQWSLYVPHSGHYMYRTGSMCVPHSCHYMYRTVVTICTASLTFNNSTFCPYTIFMCFVWISEQTAIISLYSIN